MQILMKYTLETIFNDCWERLTIAVNTPQSGFRNITVANLDANGINAYTVVLREVLVNTAILCFYTDLRSPKVQQLQKNNAVTVLAYDNQEKIQLLFKGNVTIHQHNETALHHWQQQGYKSRKSYLAQPAPSTEITEPTDGLAYLIGEHFDDNATNGYENFGVVEIKIDFLEWLKLSHEGNRRASFKPDAEKRWQGQWLIP